MQTCAQLQLQIQSLSLRSENEICQSLFRRVDSCLQEKTTLRALMRCMERKDSTRYRSLMDFFFCELFTIWRSRCFKFYEGHAPPLREIMTPMQIHRYEEAMISALIIALDLTQYGEKSKVSWSLFREEAEHYLSSASEWPY